MLHKDTISTIASPDSDVEDNSNHHVSRHQGKNPTTSPTISSPVSIFARTGTLYPSLCRRPSSDVVSSSDFQNNIIKMKPPENPFSSVDAASSYPVVPPPQFYTSARAPPPPMTAHQQEIVPTNIHHYYHHPPPQQLYMVSPPAGGAGAQGCCCQQQKQSSLSTSSSRRPNYALLTEEETREMKLQFIKKFLILKTVVPNWGIAIPAETASLDHFHDTYQLYSKQITIYVNTFYLKVGLCFLFIFLQWVIGQTGIAMEGYAISQINTINNYDCLLMELSEKYMCGNGSSSEPMSIEQRFLYFAALQAIAFVGCNFVEKMSGSKHLADFMRKYVATNVIDKLKEKGDAQQHTEGGVDNVGIPIVPGLEEKIKTVVAGGDAAVPGAAAAPAPSSAGGVLDIGKLLGSVAGLMNSAPDPSGGGFPAALGGIMSVLGNLTAGAAAPAKSPAPTPSHPPRRAAAPPTSPVHTSPPRSATSSRKRPVSFRKDPAAGDPEDE
jgi:hypothetical protein